GPVKNFAIPRVRCVRAPGLISNAKVRGPHHWRDELLAPGKSRPGKVPRRSFPSPQRFDVIDPATARKTGRTARVDCSGIESSGQKRRENDHGHSSSGHGKTYLLSMAGKFARTKSHRPHHDLVLRRPSYLSPACGLSARPRSHSISQGREPA